MIEKLLRRFVSEETEFVLKAMEQVGGNPDASSRIRNAYDWMLSQQQEATTSKLDKAVLFRVSRRLKSERTRRAAAQNAQEFAAKLLMGDTFEDPEEKATGTYGLNPQQAQYAQAQLQQAQMQQPMYAQVHNKAFGSGGLGSSLGGLFS